MLIIPVLCIALAFVLYMGNRALSIEDMARREAIGSPGGVVTS